MSEGTPPETLVEMLNEYFELMVETIFKYEGTLDKFMGDGIMALLGRPGRSPGRRRALRAVRARPDGGARAVQPRSASARASPRSPWASASTRGPCVVGYVGSSKALSYTVIGDTANTSARLCSTALAGQIVISEIDAGAPRAAASRSRRSTPASLKGKEKPMRRFNVLREQPSAVAADGDAARAG